MYPRLPILPALALLLPAPVFARVNGLAVTGCSTCHTGGRNPTVSVTVDPPLVMPGQQARIIVKVPSGGPAGLYLHAYNKGVLRELPGQGLRLVTPGEAVHSNPKPGAGGEVTFEIGWTAPSERGTVNIDVHAVASNGDRAIGGDGYAPGRLSLTIGCEGMEFFTDADGDGFGAANAPKTRLCEMQTGYALQPGDCNDFLSYVHPGASERCNDTDDDCDGMVNEGLESAMVFPDRDGDGYGDIAGQMRIGCTASGFAPSRDDCDDADRMVNPGVKEVCNTRDDNCDGRSDEGAKATCGLGWCRRAASNCTANDCVPGTPRAEECNSFDDDCDGVADNNASCPEAGKVCAGGRCLAADDAKAQLEAERMAAMADGGAPPGGGADAGAGGSGGSGSGGSGSGGGGTSGSTSMGGSSTGGSGERTGPPAKACSYGDGRSGSPAILLVLGLTALAVRRRWA
jgi:MYXO-CTERM domain-containing protein